MKCFICLMITLTFITTPSVYAQNFSGTAREKAGDAPERREESVPGPPRTPRQQPAGSGALPAGNREPGKYTVGVDDILEISVLQPDELLRVVNVAPDGTITFPYIGTVKVKGLTVPQVQEEVRSALADGYMKYPVVVVSLQESRSRKFFVYGEVIKPGAYAIAENTTVLRAISMAGGFSKFGSSSRVKVLRPKQDEAGYETVKIDITKVMNGDSENDILLKPGDMVVVSEGVF